MKLLSVILFLGAIQAHAKTINCSSTTRVAGGKIDVEIFDDGKAEVLVNYVDYLSDVDLVNYNMVGYQVVNEPVEGDLILFGYHELNLVDQLGKDAKLVIKETTGNISSRVPCHQGRVLNPVCDSNLFKKTTINLTYDNGKTINMSCF